MKQFQIILACCSFIVTGLLQAQDFAGVKYGPEIRQFVDIYLGDSTCPTPVYFDAHFNGGTTALPAGMVNDLTSAGIAIVSWESITTLTSPMQIDTGWTDAELMFAWVKANASTYNFDTTNFIVGGSSRGTILSWKYAHWGDPNIKGLYMYNALPGNVWSDSTWWYPPNEVTVSSPPIFFVYGREPGCSTDPVNPDIHDPNNGFTIMDRYTSLGIGDRDTLIHSISDSANSDRYQYLLDFALSVIDPCWSTGIQPNPNDLTQITAYPNPVQDQLQLTGLTGKETVTLRNTLGQLVIEGLKVSTLDMSNLEAGVYLLTISSESSRQTIRVIKR